MVSFLRFMALCCITGLVQTKEWSFAKDEETSACSGGAELHEKSGKLRIPGNASDSTSGNLRCSWKITVDPRKWIKVTFTKFYFPTNCSCYVDIYDYSSRLIFQGQFRSEEEAPKNVTTETNQLLVVYARRYPTSNLIGVNEGEVLEFSWQETDFNCGNLITNSSGIVTTPGYPKYKNDRHCRWNISAASDQIVSLWADKYSRCCVSFEDIRVDSCNNRRDYMIISSNQVSKKLCWLTKGIAMYGPVTIEYHSDPPIQFGLYGGFSLNYLVADSKYKACFNEIDKIESQSGILVSPEISSTYPLRCTWIVTVESSKVIQLKFNNFHIPCTAGGLTFKENNQAWLEGGDEMPKCLSQHVFSICYDFLNPLSLQQLPMGADWLQVSEIKRIVTYVTLCGTTLPRNFKTKTNSLFLQTKNYVETKIPRSFNISWSSVEGVNETLEVNSCIKLTGSKGYITSPNYPNNYTNNLDLCWTIENPSNYLIKMRLVRQDIEYALGCQFDYLIFHEKSSSKIEKLCSTMTYSRDFYGTQFDVIFHSDQINRAGGFVIAYAMQDNGTKSAIDGSCGTTNITASSGFISTPQYPVRIHKEIWESSYNSMTGSINIFCQWTITASSTQVIEVTFLQFQGLYSCPKNSSYLKFRNGKSASTKTFCTKQDPILFSTSKLDVVHQYSRSHGYYFGFMLFYQMKDSSYPAASCGGILTTSSTFESPNYPNEYLHNLNCSWTVSVRSNEIAVIHIKPIYMESTENCSADVLEVYGADNSNFQSFCGKHYYPKSFIYNGTDVIVRFRSDFAISGSGFSAYVTSYPKGFNCGRKLNSRNGTIQPPEDQDYRVLQHCYWTIAAKANEYVLISSISFNTNWRSSSSCDYLIISSSQNSKKIRRYASNITLQGPVTVQFQASPSKGFCRSGFSLAYRIEDTITTPALCGGILNKNSTLTSPNHPKWYANNLDCYWTVPVKSDERVTVEIFQLFLEASENCSADVLEVYGSNKSNFHSFCGVTYYCDTCPIKVMNFTGTDVIIHFRSDFALSLQGFTASVTSYVRETPSTTTTITSLPSRTAGTQLETTDTLFGSVDASTVSQLENTAISINLVTHITAELLQTTTITSPSAKPTESPDETTTILTSQAARTTEASVETTTTRLAAKTTEGPVETSAVLTLSITSAIKATIKTATIPTSQIVRSTEAPDETTIIRIDPETTTAVSLIQKELSSSTFAPGWNEEPDQSTSSLRKTASGTIDTPFETTDAPAVSLLSIDKGAPVTSTTKQTTSYASDLHVGHSQILIFVIVALLMHLL